MKTLKGDNLRVCLYDTTASKYKVISMATSCNITMINNTEESHTKDDVSLANKPTTTGKSWLVQVDSLNVADAALMLAAVKSMTPFTLMWDETSTSDNQTRSKAAFARKGSAYISDITLTFNDRENSAKNVTFAGTSILNTIATSEATQVTALGSYTKGQFVRLFLGNDNSSIPAKCIASAKQLTFHASLSLETTTTKDTDSDWQQQQPTSLAYDISTNALVRSDEVIRSEVQAQALDDIETIYEAGTPVKFEIANTSGANQRTKGTVIVSGSVILTNLQINGPSRQSADYTAQLTGYGEYTTS